MILVPFTASMFSLLAIAIDRYIFIAHCLQYPRIVTLKRTKIAIIMVWIVSLLNALSMAMPWTYPSASGRIYCTCMIVEASSDLYIFLYSILFNIIPIIIIVALYCLILNAASEAHKKKNSLRSMTMQALMGNRKNQIIPMGKTKSIKEESIWKKKGIPALGVMILSVTVLWLPLSCGMLVFIAQKDFRCVQII